MARYKVRPGARKDLRGIWDYSADRCNVDQANHYIAQIHGAFDRISDDPRKGDAIDDLRPGYRKYSVGRHVVFFTARDERIEIVRVLHQSMNFDDHL